MYSFWNLVYVFLQYHYSLCVFCECVLCLSMHFVSISTDHFYSREANLLNPGRLKGQDDQDQLAYLICFIDFFLIIIFYFLLTQATKIEIIRIKGCMTHYSLIWDWIKPNPTFLFFQKIHYIPKICFHPATISFIVAKGNDSTKVNGKKIKESETKKKKKKKFHATIKSFDACCSGQKLCTNAVTVVCLRFFHQNFKFYN